MAAQIQATHITFHAEVPAERRKEIADLLKRLDIDTGTKELGVKHIVRDPPKGAHLLQITQFPSEEIMATWRAHPAHQKVVDLLKASANWVSDTAFLD